MPCLCVFPQSDWLGHLDQMDILSLIPAASSALTCQEQHQEEGKEVWIFCQHVLQVQGGAIPEESGDVVPNDVVKGRAPSASDAGCSWQPTRELAINVRTYFLRGPFIRQQVWWEK